MKNRAGFYRTNMSGEAEYKSFVPSFLPLDSPINMSEEMVKILVQANKQIAILESISSAIPNISLFVSMYVRKEALLSSQIEGTQATLEDVLDPMLEANVNQDVSDVINYVKATEYALNRLDELPLCNRLIKETHSVLMQGVRGQEKCPGEFRHSQNWIGGQGSTLKNARYIPPNMEDMLEAMSNLEEYINQDDDTDLLLKAALIHYQFETIHPFLDGNGRVGRQMITMFLIEKKVLSTPVLYISYFLKKNRVEYYDRMSEVRRSGNYEQWVKFFLQAVYETAKDAVETINKLNNLHNVNKEKIKSLDKATKNTLKLFEYIEFSPIIEINKTAAALELSYNTVASAVKRLMDLNILSTVNNFQRNRTFLYADYLDILRKDT